MGRNRVYGGAIADKYNEAKIPLSGKPPMSEVQFRKHLHSKLSQLSERANHQTLPSVTLLSLVVAARIDNRASIRARFSEHVLDRLELLVHQAFDRRLCTSDILGLLSEGVYVAAMVERPEGPDATINLLHRQFVDALKEFEPDTGASLTVVSHCISSHESANELLSDLMLKLDGVALVHRSMRSYPLPIGIARRHMATKTSIDGRFRALIGLVDILLKYMVAYGMADLARIGDAKTVDHMASIIRDAFQKPVSMGIWESFCRRLFIELSKAPKEPFSPSLVRVLGGKGKKRSEVSRILQKFVKIRNDFSHGRLAVSSVRPVLSESNKLIEVVLEELSDIAATPPFVVVKMDFNDDDEDSGFKYLAYEFSGDNPVISPIEILSRLRFKKHQLYLRKHDDDSVLCLEPFFVANILGDTTPTLAYLENVIDNTPIYADATGCEKIDLDQSTLRRQIKRMSNLGLIVDSDHS